MSKPQSPSVVCFGEILWDCLPRGLFLGGAPLNVAYHLHCNGLQPRMVSAVGRDFLGDEARRRMRHWGLDTDTVARRGSRPTGTVAVTLDQKGIATFDIVRDVAWDRVDHVSKHQLQKIEPAAIVFGTLALRERHNQKALSRIFKASPQALRVADINLRAPFDRGESVNFALKHAQLLKLNEDELARFVPGAHRTPTTIEKGAKKFAARHKLSRVCVTVGARGAGLLWDGAWYWESAKPVAVRDTVGSGDAFLAGLLSTLLRSQANPGDALKKACRLGEFVASRDGATPAYRINRDGKISDEAK